MFESLDWSLLYKVGGPVVGAFSVIAGIYRHTNGKIDKLEEKKVDKETLEKSEKTLSDKIDGVEDNLNLRMDDLKESVNTRINDQHESIKLLIETQGSHIISTLKEEIKNNNGK